MFEIGHTGIAQFNMSMHMFLCFIQVLSIAMADPIPQTLSYSNSLPLDSLSEIDFDPSLQADVNPPQIISNIDGQVDPSTADLEYITSDSDPTLLADSNTAQDDCGPSQTNRKMGVRDVPAGLCKTPRPQPDLDDPPLSGGSKPSDSMLPERPSKIPDYFLPPHGLKVTLPPDEDDDTCPYQHFPLRVCCAGDAYEPHTQNGVTWFGWVDECAKCRSFDPSASFVPNPTNEAPCARRGSLSKLET